MILNPAALCTERSPPFIPGGEARRRRFSPVRTSHGKTYSRALIQRPAPKAPPHEQAQARDCEEDRAARPRGRAAYPIIAAEMNHTPRPRGQIEASKRIAFQQQRPGNTKRKGSRQRPAEGHRRPAGAIRIAPARFAATKAAIATGGEIIERHP